MELGSIVKDIHTQTEMDGSKLDNLMNEVTNLETTVRNQRFSLSNVSKDESKHTFYTVFTSFAALMACYNFLGPAVDYLTHTYMEENYTTNKHCRPRSLNPE